MRNDVVSAPFDVDRVRADFPILARTLRGKPLAYLDSAATAQKPRVVLEAMNRFLSEYNSNVHRGVHELSERATTAYEATRESVRRLLNAREAREIVYVRGTTEAVNLVAQSFGRTRVGAGDEILITGMEHHSNIVPWQLLCEQTGATLRVVPIDDDGELLLDAYQELLGPRTRLVAAVHVSNALGTVNPVRSMVRMAHERGIPVLLDGAQAVPHMPVDVQELDCDFYAFSGHKAFGPTGIGILYGRAELLEAMPPWQGGGDMIKSVRFEKTIYSDIPFKFEAGTPNVTGVIGLGAASEYLLNMDRAGASVYEDELLAYGTALLAELPGLRFVGGAARHRQSILSFVVEGVHPHDLGTILDHEGIAIRTGHHCAQPVMERYGVPATARASIAFYNTRDELDRLAAGVRRASEMFA